GLAYLAVGASYLAGAAALLSASAPVGTTPPAAGSLWQSIVDFVTAMRKDPVLPALMLLTAGAEILGFAHQALFPSLARDVLGVGPEGLGAMNAARSVGGILGLIAVTMRSATMGGGVRAGAAGPPPDRRAGVIVRRRRRARDERRCAGDAGTRRCAAVPTRAAVVRLASAKRRRPAIHSRADAPKECDMKAAVFHGPHKELTIENVDIAKPIAREVLVRTVASGVCHSDLHFIEGLYP